MHAPRTHARTLPPSYQMHLAGSHPGHLSFCGQKCARLERLSQGSVMYNTSQTSPSPPPTLSPPPPSICLAQSLDLRLQMQPGSGSAGCSTSCFFFFPLPSLTHFFLLSISARLSVCVCVFPCFAASCLSAGCVFFYPPPLPTLPVFWLPPSSLHRTHSLSLLLLLFHRLSWRASGLKHAGFHSSCRCVCVCVEEDVASLQGRHL